MKNLILSASFPGFIFDNIKSETALGIIAQGSAIGIWQTIIFGLPLLGIFYLIN